MKELLEELKQENAARANTINNGSLDARERTISIYVYNNTLDIIKRMELKLKRDE